jgi:hypothetical protein
VVAGAGVAILCVAASMTSPLVVVEYMDAKL